MFSMVVVSCGLSVVNLKNGERYFITLQQYFFPMRTLGVEWIRSLVFFGGDLQDYWDLFRLRRVALRPKAILSK